jgi:DNA-binding transcriptional MerR regulator
LNVKECIVRIGELARRAGVSTSAIRFYEASGLLPAGARSDNRYRHYGPDALRRLQFIQLAQRLGFTLDSLRGLFALGHDEFPREEVLAALQRRRAEIARLREELDAQDAELQRLARECSRAWERGACPDEAVFATPAQRRRKAG